MGLWREVYLTTTGPVSLRNPAVFSKLNSPANDRAELTVSAVLKNAGRPAGDRHAAGAHRPGCASSRR